MHALSKLGQNHRDVLFRSQHEHQFQLGHLDVDRVIVVAEEHTDVITQNFRSLLLDQDSISQGEVLDFWWFGEQGDEWW